MNAVPEAPVSSSMLVVVLQICAGQSKVSAPVEKGKTSGGRLGSAVVDGMGGPIEATKVEGWGRGGRGWDGWDTGISEIT